MLEKLLEANPIPPRRRACGGLLETRRLPSQRGQPATRRPLCRTTPATWSSPRSSGTQPRFRPRRRDDVWISCWRLAKPTPAHRQGLTRRRGGSGRICRSSTHGHDRHVPFPEDKPSLNTLRGAGRKYHTRRRNPCDREAKSEMVVFNCQSGNPNPSAGETVVDIACARLVQECLTPRFAGLFHLLVALFQLKLPIQSFRFSCDTSQMLMK